MIETSEILVTSDGVLIPKGTRLDFKGGRAKYLNHPIERKLVPLHAIKGASGPFMNACCATMFNEIKAFQLQYNRKYQDWAHCIVSGDYLFIYIWDTREVIDVIKGVHQAVRGGNVTRTLVSRTTGERIQHVIGRTKYGWAKTMYEMMMWPGWHRPDNGLPLVCKNPEWQKVIDDFNSVINTKFAYEAVHGSQFKTSVVRYTPGYESELRKAKLPHVKSEPWLHLGFTLGQKQAAYAIWVWDTRQVVASGLIDAKFADTLMRISWNMKDGAIDNRQMLKGSGEAVDIINRSMVRVANEAESDLRIIPAQGIANQHNVILGDVQVATIIANKLEQAPQGYKKSDATEEDIDVEETGDSVAETSEIEETDEYEYQDTPAYLNTKENKLTVLGNDGKPLELACLANDTVTVDELLEELAAKLADK